MIKNKEITKEQIGKDIIAGIIVAIIALPLSIALGISSGVTPEKGLITAIIAGFVISLVSTILCCGTFNWLSLVFSIIGLVNSKNMNNEGKGLAIAGIVISSIFLILTIILYALGITASVLEGIQN